jgi:hypothetical protein
MKNRILLLMSLIIAISFTCDLAYAERKNLKPPALLSFSPEEYLDKEYKRELDELKALFKEHKNDRAAGKLSELVTIVRKSKSEKGIVEIRNEIEKYKGNKELFNKLGKKLEKIKTMIESGKFNKNQEGVDFKIDKANRKYIVSWDEKGKEVSKYVHMVPEMELSVEAEIVSKTEAGKKMMVYRYWIENGKHSKASFSELYLENLFPQAYILEKIKGKYGRMSRMFKKSETIMQDVSYPEGYVNYFIFFNYTISDEMLVTYKPGEKQEHPYELEEIEESLPGIVECGVSVSASEFNPSGGISAHTDPEMAVDIIRGLNLGPHRYRYRGKTIGPVPMPEAFDRGAFIDKIISYKDGSIEQGWIDKKPAIDFVNEGLLAIKSNPGDKDRIKEFIAELDEYYKKHQILSEAYALLKYNLEYLLSKM